MAGGVSSRLPAPAFFEIRKERFIVSEHIELPFHQEADRIKDDMGSHICYLQRPVGHSARAGMLISCERAAYMVRACNAHGDLLGLLGELSKDMQTQQNNGNLVWPGWFKGPIQKIKAAIKKAEPETSENMIVLGSLTKADIGKWVEYSSHNTTEKGRIKSFNDKWIFVAFNCADDWDNFRNYTAAACAPESITFIKGEKP